MSLLLYPKESYDITGCLLKVYNGLGSGFLEAVYQEALELEFRSAGIPYKREVPLQIQYINIMEYCSRNSMLPILFVMTRLLWN